jgi:hypothetical protein
MKLSELKKLDKNELVKRFPVLQMRDYHGDPAFYEKTGEPILEAGDNDWGWNDIILCWAEKVKPIYEKMPKDARDKFYVSQLKEKYGDMRLYLSCYPTGPFEKISEYTTMVEHLSTFTCINCGHISKSSDGKKLFAWSTRGGWITITCKKCARKAMFRDNYRLHGKMTNNQEFKHLYRKIEGDWFARITRYARVGNETYRYDCRELFEDMF